MQHTLAPSSSSLNDCFADYAVELAEETSHTPMSSVSTAGQPPCNLRCAYDIDMLGRNEEELQQHNWILEERAAVYGMEISSEKSQIVATASSQDHLPTYR